MHLIDAAGHVDHQFVHEDPATNRPPTEVDAAWLNAVQNELANAIKGFGLTLDKNDQSQLLKAISSALATGSCRTAVRVASTSNIALLGLQNIDGVALVVGDRVLVKGQDAEKDNGIYVAAVGAWSRATDLGSTAILKSSVIIPVSEGVLSAGSLWMLKAYGQVTVGSTAMTFQWIAGPSVPDQPANDKSKNPASTFFVSRAVSALDARFLELESRQKSLGDGQTYQDVTLSRMIGANYLNNTGRTIFAFVDFHDVGSARITFRVGDHSWTSANPEGGEAGSLLPVSLVIPNGTYYSVGPSTTAVNFRKWLELR